VIVGACPFFRLPFLAGIFVFSASFRWSREDTRFFFCSYGLFFFFYPSTFFCPSPVSTGGNGYLPAYLRPWILYGRNGPRSPTISLPTFGPGLPSLPPLPCFMLLPSPLTFSFPRSFSIFALADQGPNIRNSPSFPCGPTRDPEFLWRWSFFFFSFPPYISSFLLEDFSPAQLYDSCFSFPPLFIEFSPVPKTHRPPHPLLFARRSLFSWLLVTPSLAGNILFSVSVIPFFSLRPPFSSAF